MRFLRVLVGLLLILSLAGNAVLWLKFRAKRPIITINGDSLSKKDIDDYLEQQAGPNVKAVLIRRTLIQQEAKKQNAGATDAEVDEEFTLLKEQNWQVAREVNANPWKASEARNNIRERISQIRLLTKDIPVSDEEMQEEYKESPQKYDKPNKARTNLALVLNPARVAEIKKLLEQNNPPVSPTVIMQNFKNEVFFIGNENKFTFYQRLGSPENKDVFDMKPGQVRQFPPGAFAQSGAKAILVRMVEAEPGSKANLSDSKTKEKLRLTIASRRAKPWQEYFVKMWDDAKKDFEDPNDKRYVEMVYFPDRAAGQAGK